MIEHRWKNAILDAESDAKANIDSDHYPVKAKLKIKLKKITKQQTDGRKKYVENTKEQQTENNKKLKI